MTVTEVPFGSLAFDTARHRVGHVMDRLGTRIQLRPLGGGVEWDAQPEDVRPATALEELTARLAARDARSRGRR
ncbi:hypothetical protein [Streptomyces sp. NPDC003077]|uniref:hypothetical protein n=1 Tax=Streptomyces sp. NPDC003077 TaxID=3154443 RepID=UPI0033A2516D